MAPGHIPDCPGCIWNGDGLQPVHIRSSLRLLDEIVYETYFGLMPRGGHMLHLNGDDWDCRPDNLKLLVSDRRRHWRISTNSKVMA